MPQSNWFALSSRVVDSEVLAMVEAVLLWALVPVSRAMVRALS